MEVPTLYILLAKLEEEIGYQRKVINTFLAIQPRTYELTLKTLEILRRLTQSFRLVSLILDEMESLTDRYVREQALLLSSESLSLSAILLPTLEHLSPIFLESVRLQEEPILERIEAVVEFIENSVGEQEMLATEELARTVEDIMRTLEYHIRIGERVLAKIV